MTTIMKFDQKNLVPLTKTELLTIEGGGIIGVSPYTIAQAAVLVGAAIYGVGYAVGKAVYHATH